MWEPSLWRHLGDVRNNCQKRPDQVGTLLWRIRAVNLGEADGIIRQYHQSLRVWKPEAESSYESVVVIISYLRSSFIRTFRGRPEVRRECTIPVLAGRLNPNAFSGVFGITQETV
ncbi:hypothetical protein CBS147355_1668 [Penicillium roqueforti]|nr:hypothetical protein CBS147355_1668 [Penicillium roqueforti]